MNTLPSLFLNETIITEIETFCAGDPEYIQTREKFYEAAQEIARQVGFEVYDSFEKRFSDYLYRTADLYYLFGLDLRQELLQMIGTGG